MIPLTDNFNQHNETIRVNPQINDTTLLVNVLKKQLASECIKRAEKEIIFKQQYDAANNQYKQAYQLLSSALRIIRDLPETEKSLMTIRTHKQELAHLLQKTTNFLNEFPNRLKANTISEKEISDNIGLIDTLDISANNICSILCELCDWPDTNQERNREKDFNILLNILASFCKHHQISRMTRVKHQVIQSSFIESIEKSALLNQVIEKNTHDVLDMDNALTSLVTNMLTNLVPNDKLDFLLVSFNVSTHQCLAKISLITRRFGSELYQLDLFAEGKLPHRYHIPCHSTNDVYTGAKKAAALITSLHASKDDTQEQLSKIASEHNYLSSGSEKDYFDTNSTQNTYRLFDFILKSTLKNSLSRPCKRIFMLGQDTAGSQFFYTSFKQYLTEMLMLILEEKSPTIAEKMKHQRYQLSILRAFS